jgi:hypothetical protein
MPASQVIPPNQSRISPIAIHVTASADPILPQPGQEATYRLMLGILVENDLLAMRFEDDRIAQRATSHEFLLARP